MDNPEQDVINKIDELVDWELTESPAAKVEHGDYDDAIDLAALEAALRQGDVHHLMMRDQRRLVVISGVAALTNVGCVIWDIAPIWSMNLPSMTTPINFLAAVFCGRMMINSLKELKTG